MTKQELLNYVNEFNNVSFAELTNRFENTQGETALLGNTENIVIWPSLDKEFAASLMELLDENLIHLHPTSELTYMIDGAAPLIPIAKRKCNYKTPHWVPCVLKKGPDPDKEVKG